MASPESTAAPAPLSATKENTAPISSKIAELNQSRTELLNRIQSLKQDLHNWRSKLDTQVKVYRDLNHSLRFMQELSELKKTLNVEVEQLRTEFQDLRTTLQQQQEDVTSSLRNLGLNEVSGDGEKSESKEIKTEETDKEEEVLAKEDSSVKITEN